MIREWLSQLDTPFTGEELFDHLPDSVFFIKNAGGQYLVVNRTLVDRCGLGDKRDLIGRTPGQVLRPPLGESFARQDQHVLQTGRPLLSQEITRGSSFSLSRSIGQEITVASFD